MSMQPITLESRMDVYTRMKTREEQTILGRRELTHHLGVPAVEGAEVCIQASTCPSWLARGITCACAFLVKKSLGGLAPWMYVCGS